MRKPPSLSSPLTSPSPSTKHSRLHVETSPTILGSCCDAGRWRFADCDTWWYDCTKGWGINNHTSWFRHGPTGFTMPTGTEHGGRCSYTSTRELCPLPPSNCEKRFPQTVEDVCEEIPLIN
jgi:hypothetical protein